MFRLILITLFVVATAVWAQDDTTDDEAVTESVPPSVPPSVPQSVDEMSAEELDDLDLDRNEDHTEEDEDVFKPSDVVSYQQSVPFPVDI